MNVRILAVTVLVVSGFISPSKAANNDELRAQAREAARERRRQEAKSKADDNPELSNAQLNQQLQVFITAFLDSANRNDAVTQSNYYAPKVDYMDYGIVDKAFILDDIRKYNAKWPSHHLMM